MIIWFGLFFAFICVYLFTSIALISDVIDEWNLLNNRERFVFLLTILVLVLFGSTTLNTYILQVVKFCP